MRVLALRRQRFGGIATYTQLLPTALDREGIELVVDDTDAYIPDKTGPGVDRDVSKRVRDAAKGFDLVHAFGFRTAWACSEAFGGERWLYTAHDMPKTTHPELIARLNTARAGVCSSEAVRYALEAGKANKLYTVRPGLPRDRRLLDRNECRKRLGASEDTFLLVAAGRFCKEHSLESAIYVTDALPHNTRLVLCGEGEEEQKLRGLARERVTVTTRRFAQQDAIAAADLVLVPSTVAGFSFTAVEAMLQGTPVAMRRTGGLAELAEDHRTGFLFETDEELFDLLNHLCYKREALAEVGRAGRQHALSAFDIDRTAKEMAAIYRLART